MNTKAFSTTIRGDTEGAGTPAIGAPGAFYAVDFPALKPKDLKPGPLPPATADRSVGRGLTKSEEEETISINRSGRSTYLEEKSVQTSGATPGLKGVHRVPTNPLHQALTVGLSFGKSSGGGCEHPCPRTVTRCVVDDPCDARRKSPAAVPARYQPGPISAGTGTIS
ncbi:MAG: hypothetical protein ACYDB1_11705 [Acidiferrobacteraceae bacterium]